MKNKFYIVSYSFIHSLYCLNLTKEVSEFCSVTCSEFLRFFLRLHGAVLDYALGHIYHYLYLMMTVIAETRRDTSEFS
jgi:hypothetical protein